MCSLFARVSCGRTQVGGQRLTTLLRAPQGGDESDKSVRGGDTNGCRSHVPWPKHSTTPPGLRSATRAWWRKLSTVRYAARRQPPGHGGRARTTSPSTTIMCSPARGRNCSALWCTSTRRLDVPALQWVEEANAFLLAPLLDAQEQAIVQEIPAVPVASSVVRAVQPADVEQVLDVSVLHTVDDDFGFSGAQLRHLVGQCRAQRRPDRLLRIAEYTVFDESVDPVEVPLDSVSVSFEEQVVDVPVRGHVASVFWFWLYGTGGGCSRTWSCLDVWNRWWMFPGLRMFFVQTLREVLDRQLLRWTLRRSSFLPRKKKCYDWAAVEWRTGCELQLVHAGGLWP